VLRATFCFLPGIGPRREAALWRAGVADWASYRRLARVPGVAPEAKRRHDDVLAIAEEAIERDPGFFARTLPAREQWRALGEYGEGAAYVDVETDQDGRLTVVGAMLGGRFRAFVRGRDLDARAVSDFLAPARALVTFNGLAFDARVMEREGVALPRVPHAHLLHACRRLGLRGGLKKVERAIGLARADEVAGLSGYDAILLWHRHLAGEEGALERLVAYNRADVENLAPLAAHAYARLAAQAAAQRTLAVT
jgi:uncharacterized protein YprB with RNaseH-like and TPR domain